MRCIWCFYSVKCQQVSMLAFSGLELLLSLMDMRYCLINNIGPFPSLTCVCGCFCYPFLLSWPLLRNYYYFLIIFPILTYAIRVGWDISGYCYKWIHRYQEDKKKKGTTTRIFINLNALQYTHGLHIYIWKFYSFFYYYILEKVMKLDMVLMWKINEIL